MQIFLLYLFLFIFGSMLGWVIEVLFRRFCSAKKWVNPGFNKGPWLPLYGFGTVLMFTMCFVCVSFLPSNLVFYNPLGNLFGKDVISGPTVADLLPIILMWISMVLLEFIAGVIFVKGFHVKLWDYSNMKGNIMGIICPVFTLIWGMVAVIYYYAINPFLYKLASDMYIYMFGGEGEIAHFGFIFLMGCIYGIFIYDFVVSTGAFAKVSKFATESGIIAKAEELREHIAKAEKGAKDKIFASLPEQIQQSIIEQQNKPKKENKIKAKIDEKIYIDPEKEKNKGANYDENGRPIKTDNEN